MLVSPFSVLLGYSAPDGKGIYLKPTSEAAPDGWGEPRLDTATNPPTPIVPGTPGGPFANVLVRKKEGEYKANASRYFQMSGNISWWGELRDPLKPSKGRHVLSYNGPTLRYFRDESFTYGSTIQHNEIYYMGNCASIAPGPVLGACIRKTAFYDPITQTTNPNEIFLVVAVYQNGQDCFYMKRWAYTSIRNFNLTDEIREKQMQLYDAAEEPYGWMLLGKVAKQESAYAPETPWFFNKSGDAAACMRRNRKYFNNGNVDKEEDQFLRYKVSLNSSNFSFTNLSNLEPLIYTERFVKEHPTYQSTDIYGYTHTWQEDHMKVTIKLDGTQYVMCDYVEDTLYYGKLKFQVNRVQEQYYTKGTDPADYTVTVPGTGQQNISNRDLRVGPRQHNFFEYGVLSTPYVPEPADHEATTWVSVAEKVTLYYGPEGNDESNQVDLHSYNDGTSDEWEGNPRQQNNPYLYFYEFYTRWMRGFFDIRDLAFFSHDMHKYGLWQELSSLVSQTIKYKESLYSSANLSGEDRRSVKKTQNGLSNFGWSITDMETWPQTMNTTLNRTTYIGLWPNDNASGEKTEPGSRSFYASDTTGDYAADWPNITTLLYGPKNVCKGNGVVTEQSALAYSVEVPDVESEGKFVIISDTKPAGDPASVVGYGDKFYPVGTC